MLDLISVIVSGNTLITATRLNVEEMTKLLQDAVDRVNLMNAQTTTSHGILCCELTVLGME